MIILEIFGFPLVSHAVLYRRVPEKECI